MNTPWGSSECVEDVGPGIVFVQTASHGGYKLEPFQNAKIPLSWRQASFNRNGMDGWYEEDCDWCLVALIFPQFFSHAENAIEHAADMFKNYFADKVA